MKKLLSIVLAIAMIAAMLPTAFAAVDEKTGVITYSFSGGSDGLASSNTPIETVEGEKICTEYAETSGRYWAYLGTNLATAITSTGFIWYAGPSAKASLRMDNQNEDLNSDTWVAFKIQVPYSADYKITGDMFKYKRSSKKLGIYMAPFEETIKEKFEDSATYGSVSVEVGETTTTATRTGAAAFNTLGIEKYKLCELNTYQSSSTSIGNYTIKDFISLEKGEYVLVFHNGGNGHITPRSIMLTPIEAVTDDISFVATSNVGEKDMMTVVGFNYDEFTDSIPAGTFVQVTAPEKTGYEFKHWVRGSADNGVYVSDNPTYSFTALTHTFLTAIYEDVSETTQDNNTATVEFYNGNGQYLSKATSTVGETVALPTEEPEMTGFEFANQWKTENGVFTAETTLIKKLTRAVAQFNPLSAKFKITCGDEEVELSYGDEHTFTCEKNVYWTREGAVVGYGTSYTHAAWDTTEITTSESGELVPVVLLDDTTKGGARMIEYNAAGKNVLEVGIVFGGDGVNIGSCSSKATSQYKNQHGQFTAKPYGTETHARGYMIYEDNGTYRVIYSE